MLCVRSACLFFVVIFVAWVRAEEGQEARAGSGGDVCGIDDHQCQMKANCADHDYRCRMKMCEENDEGCLAAASLWHSHNHPGNKEASTWALPAFCSDDGEREVVPYPSEATQFRMRIKVVEAVEESDPDAVMDALCNMADPDSGDKFDHPLMYKVATYDKVTEENTEICKMIIEAGANVNYQTYRTGSAPLHQAVSRGNVECIRLMLAAGADANILDDQDRNPLWAATANVLDPDREIVKMLVEAGANIDQQGKDGWCPLHKCAEKGFTDLVEYFMEHGCDLHIVNPKQRINVLHHAARNNNHEIAKLMLSAGVSQDVLSIRPHGMRPIDMAKSGQLKQLFRDYDKEM